ncbi:hypothetical protein ACEPAI_7119 [Sanghuangporus weigelae]
MLASRIARRRTLGCAGTLCGRARRNNVRGVANAAAAASQNITPIEKIVRDSIKATGPMSISTYMQLCLSHPTHGYYMDPANPIFGKKGDFITSPEISQVFGELIAIWHLHRWIAAGRPKRIRIVELGPGRGTLMSDALRAFSQNVLAREALKSTGTVHLVETSQPLRKLQGETLRSFGALERLQVEGEKEKEFLQWHDSLEGVKEAEKEKPVDGDTFTMVIAHEFFDALPVHVLEKGTNGWHEIQITSIPDPAAPTILTSSNSFSPHALPPLRLIRNPEISTLSNFLGSISPRYSDLPVGSRVEVSTTSFKLARQVAELVNDPKSAGGSALIIDYGWGGISGNSLRAFKKHQIVDIFRTPGECDLTANVDFELLREAISDAAETHGPIAQRWFLKEMGIMVRLVALEMAKAAAKQKAQVEGKKTSQEYESYNPNTEAVHRLLDRNGMGEQYKVFAITGIGGREMTSDEAAERGCYPFCNEEFWEEDEEIEERLWKD